MTIRLRLFVGFLAVIVLGVVLMTRDVVEEIRPYTYQTTEQSLAETAALLASFVESRASKEAVPVEDLRVAMDGALKRDLSASIHGLTKRTVDLRVYVTDARGMVLYDSDQGRDEGLDYSRWNDVHLTLRGRYGARASRADPDDASTSVHYVAAPIRADDEIVGVLSAGKPVRELGAVIASARRRVLWAGLASLGLASFISVLLAHWISLPLGRLAAYAQAVAAGGRPVFPKLHGREVVALGGALEEMRRALEGKAYVESYVRSLTHEIKAPLSAIRASSELLTEDMAPEDRARFLGHIRTETARLASLVDRMLELAAIESRAALVRTEELPVADLVDEVRDSVAPLAQVGTVVVQGDTSDCGTVQGDPLLLRQALVNLVHNALAASPEGGRIEIACESGPSAVTLVVRDGGPGIPEYALPKVFERFFSLPLPGTDRRGTGLGLAFVREVAKLHGGDASLENAPGGGAVARLRIARNP